MAKFTVTIEEHVTQAFDVEAETIEEAMQIAEDKWHEGEFVLEPGNLSATLMMAENEDGTESTEWSEF